MPAAGLELPVTHLKAKASPAFASVGPSIVTLSGATASNGQLVNHIMLSICYLRYTLGRPLIRDVLFCFLSEVPVSNGSGSAQ